MPAFLFTDIEGSTQKWEKHPEIMSRALNRHNMILKTQLEKFGGKIIKHTGDGMFAIFDGGEPIYCVVEIQKAIQKTAWGPLGEFRIRSILHSGPAKRVGDDYFGPVINRTARIMATGWGGQILLTPEVVNAHNFPAGTQLKDLGIHQLKDLARGQPLFQLVHKEFVLKKFPPLRSLPRQPVEVATSAPEPPSSPPPLKPMSTAVQGVHHALETGLKLSETFDQTHTFVQQAAYGGRGRRDGQFMLPSGGAVDAQGQVYINDTIQGTLQLFELDGHFVRRLGAVGGVLDLGLVFNSPSAVVVDRKGLIYVCDTKNCRIQICTKIGEPIKRIGRPLVVVGRSEPPGSVGFNNPRGLALDEEEGLLYVSDTGNHRLRALKPDGTPVMTFGQHGLREGEFLHPMGIAVGPQGRLYVADSENYRIQVFERGFKFQRAIGRRGPGPGDFAQPPTHVAVTRNNELIVCDRTDRIRIFGESGNYLGSISGWRLENLSPKYTAVVLREPQDLIAIDDNGCRWHHFVYKEVKE